LNFCTIAFVVVTGDEFRGIFEKFGTILDSVVIIDRTTKRSRGFGFITFEDAKVAQKLLHSGKASNDSASNSVSHSGSIFIRGKRCEIKASEPKEMNSSSNSLEQPLQGTSNVEYPTNHGGISFDRPLSPNHYSAPLHPYSYEVPRQILHHGDGYHFYPNSGCEETDGNEHYSMPGCAYNSINRRHEVFANGDHVSSYTEQFGVDVNRNGMMASQNELLYSPQPFVYDNCVPYTHQMMLPHAPAYGSMYPMHTTWHHPVDYSTQNEYVENSAPIGER